MLVGESDERLVVLAQGGDERAFTAIVARYRAPLLRYCLRYLPPESADDALQQTFINAHAALSRDGAQKPVALRPWLYRIAHNAALNVARDPQVGLARVPETLDGHERTEDVVQQRDHLDRVVSAMKALPENQRDVIVRHELGGDSHERIAKDLGMSAGAVRQLAYRARAAVRAAAAALIPGPLVRLLPWLSGAEGTASSSAPVLAKAAVAVVIAGGVGGGAVHEMTERDHADRRPRAAAVASPAAASRTVRQSAEPVAEPRTSSGAAERTVTSTRRRERAAPVEKLAERAAPREDNSGPGSGSSGSGSDNSGPGSSSSGSGSGSSGSGSSGSGSSGSGSSGSGTSGSGSSGSGSSGSGTSGSGSSGSGSGTSGSGSESSGSSGSGSSGSGSGDDVAESPEDDSGGSSGHG